YPAMIAAFERALEGERVSLALKVGRRHFECWLAPSRGRNRRPNGVIGIATDISEERRTAAALRASEQRLRDVIAAGDEVIWELATDGRVAFVSENCAALLGVPAAALIDGDPLEVVSLEARLRLVRWLMLLRRRPRPFKDVELPLALADGRKLWVSVSGLPHRDAAGR